MKSLRSGREVIPDSFAEIVLTDISTISNLNWLAIAVPYITVNRAEILGE